MVANKRAFMVCPPIHEVGVSEKCLWTICYPYGYTVFYTYYQISRTDESDEAASEPTKEGELKSHWEGSHSPFGFIWQIASTTGWSVEYILKGVNYQTLIMMLSDAPRYIDSKENKTEKTEEEEAEDIVGFFQSNLKQ